MPTGLDKTPPITKKQSHDIFLNHVSIHLLAVVLACQDNISWIVSLLRGVLHSNDGVDGYASTK